MRFRNEELARQFPGKAERIQMLGHMDDNFRKLCDSYRELNRAIQRRATDAVPTDRKKVEDLRRTRAILKEAIAASLV